MYTLHNYYLRRYRAYDLVDAIHEEMTHVPAGSIELVAIGQMSVDTMSEQDKVTLSGKDATFLFLLKGFADLSDASDFLNAFMENVNEE